jgi:hypothetical protein
MAMEEDAGRGYCHARRESTLKHVRCGGNFLTRPPTGRYFSPALPPIASQSISRDVPLAQTRVFRFSPLCPKGSSQTVLHCAHQRSTF